ncbi:MAG TPA: S-layer homology domain-containing protein, partial [Chloroflexia bacterium]|nr:S-layer homology domain-containing protein [Chloroflexia bacterium]
MRSPTRRALACVAVLAVVALGGPASLAQNAGDAGRSPAPAAPGAAGDWPMYGHDISRTNYNPDETTINAGNVAQLVSRWQVNVGLGSSATSGAPSVLNGVVYVPSSAASPASNFFALDAVSGAQAWAKNIGWRNSCFNVGIGSTPAISGTTVVVGADNAASNPAYHGINTIDGTVVWTNTMSVGPSGFPWESPVIFGDRAYLGIASRCDNPSVRGELRAVNVATGATINSAFFVNPGEAGGGIWNSPAMSPDGSMIFVGTGEDYTCTPCTYTRAMVSLNPQTLAILQYHQEPSPNQDLDFGTTPVVFHDSQGRTLVGAGHKNGTFYAYDATNITGGAIWSRSGGTSVGLMPAYDPNFGTGGTLFIVNSSITAVDPANGGVRWGPVSIGTSHGNIAIANGLIFVNAGANGLQVRSETNGALLRTLTPLNPGSANSGVVVSNGFIYWHSGAYVNAWSLPQGTPTTTPSPGAATATRTTAPTSTPVPPSNTPVPPSSTPVPPSNTATVAASSTVAPSNTVGPTQTPGGGSATPAPPTVTVPPPSATAQPTATNTAVVATVTPCPIQFTDVSPTDPFYPFIRCLACRGIISGYSDGTYRGGNNLTRGQAAKIISNAAGFSDAVPSTQQSFEDVPMSDPFWVYIERLASRGYISGYQCGFPPAGNCVPPANRPYFLTYNSITRGQIA